MAFPNPNYCVCANNLGGATGDEILWLYMVFIGSQCKSSRLKPQVAQAWYLRLFSSFSFSFATHKQHYKELIKRRKEEKRMMTIVARRPKGIYKAYVS